MATYFFQKISNMVLPMKKAEKLRRKRISRSLKRYHSDKKILKELDFLLTQELDKKQKNKWQVKEERKKVKTFPNKRSKKEFFYSTKKRYVLKKAIKVKNNLDLKEVSKAVRRIKPKIVNDLKSINKKKNDINLGYRIKMTFQSMDKDPKKDKVVDSTSFLKGYSPHSMNAHDEGFDLLRQKMLARFKQYISTTGFFGLEFKGLEAEIEE